MRWSEELTLIATNAPEERTDAQGFTSPSVEKAVTVYANKKSVGYNEFYKADQSGQYVRFKFDVHTEEYTGQRLAEYEGKRYYVLRTYEQGNGDITELTLSDLPRGGGASG